MQVLGFTAEERETINKLLASVLHLGNVYFHRKQLRHGQEGVEIGSDVEIKWTAHLLQVQLLVIMTGVGVGSDRKCRDRVRQEGVEKGSDVEIKWTAHLLQVQLLVIILTE